MPLGLHMPLGCMRCCCTLGQGHFRTCPEITALTAIIAILSPCRREQRAGRANGGGALAANGGAPSGMGEAGQLGMGSLQVPGLSGGGISGLGFSGLM